jgi:uncharacterized protein
MRRRHIPLRSCVACRTQRPKGELTRIVRQPDGAVRLDPTGKTSGRGAYLCRSTACLRLARKKKSLERSLGGAPSEEEFAALEAAFAAAPPPINVDTATVPHTKSAETIHEARSD